MGGKRGRRRVGERRGRSTGYGHMRRSASFQTSPLDETLGEQRGSWKTKPGSMPGAHWSQHFESHDDLCALSSLAAAANDEVLSSLFSRGRHRSPLPERSLLQAALPSPEGRRDSARKDFVQELLPSGPNRQGEQLALPRPRPVSFHSSRCVVSLDEASSSSWQQPSPSAHRRSSYASMPARRSGSATEIPSTLEECGAEIVRLRAVLEAERVAVQVLRAARP